MLLSDPVGDMVTRIRNAQSAGRATVSFPATKLKKSILDLLVSEGFIASYELEDSKYPSWKNFRVVLKYHTGHPVIRSIKRLSRPGRRWYVCVSEIPRICNGLGVAVVSTSKGILSDSQARNLNVGGELLFSIF